MEPGLWDVEVQGGTKREFEYYHERWLNQPLPEINGIEGAWVKRDDDRRQLEAQKGASVLTNSPSGPFFPFGLAHTPCRQPALVFSSQEHRGDSNRGPRRVCGRREDRRQIRTC